MLLMQWLMLLLLLLLLLCCCCCCCCCFCVAVVVVAVAFVLSVKVKKTPEKNLTSKAAKFCYKFSRFEVSVKLKSAPGFFSLLDQSMPQDHNSGVRFSPQKGNGTILLGLDYLMRTGPLRMCKQSKFQFLLSRPGQNCQANKAVNRITDNWSFHKR